MKVFLSIFCTVLTVALGFFVLWAMIAVSAEMLFGTRFAILNVLQDTFDLTKNGVLKSIVGTAILYQLIVEIRKPLYESAPIQNNYGISGAGIAAAQKAFPQRLKKIKKK